MQRRSRLLRQVRKNSGSCHHPWLEKSAFEEEQSDIEVNAQRTHVDERRYEGGRCACRIEANASQHEREHRSRERPERYDSDERESHDHGDLRIVRAVAARYSEILPYKNSRDAEQSEQDS